MNAMPAGPTCSSCGSPLSPSALEGLCAACLGKAVLSDPVELKGEKEALPQPGGEQPGDRIGNYRLLQKIGEGGFGVVYMAEQERPVRRRVALKVIKLGMDTRQVVARFEAERQALALMDHPNIARVLDAGATDSGRPYFVMELVKGIKITQYCDQNHLDLNERLGLFLQICHAIQHAHQKGIIHRDIKPSNIMVTMHDGVPVPKVIDFGIAKATEMPLTDKTLFTMYEQFMGTPAYMSPEQAEMSGLDIDTRSDIYSLGVLLYELLTGRPPFDGKQLVEKGIEEARRTIREVEPPRPSTCLSTLINGEMRSVAANRGADGHKLLSLVRGDLDWIVMKCIEKDRTRRYETANGVAMDVKRYLNQEPIVARPPSNIYRFRKLVRRNKAAFAAAAMIVAALVLGLGAATWSLIRERTARAQIEQARIREQRERQRAEDNAAQAGAANTRLEIERAELLFASDNASEALAYLARVLRRNPTNGVVAERIMSALSQRNFCLPLFPLRHEGAVTAAQYSRDGTRIVTASKDKTARVWDSKGGRLVTDPLQHEAEVLHAQFSSNGLRIITASMDKTARVWDAINGQPLSEPLKHGAGVTFAEFSPDGQFVVTASLDKTARIWKVKDGALLATLPHQAEVHCARFSPDGTLVLTACETFGKYAQSELWDARTGKSLRPLRYNYSDYLRFPEFSPEGDRVLIPGNTRVWDARLHQSPPISLSHPDWTAISARFGPDGQRVATTSYDNTARLWDLHGALEITPPLKHEHHVLCVDFSPDGRKVITGSRDNTARLWDAASGEPLSEPLPHPSTVLSAQFSPDGLRVLTRCDGDIVWIWDVRVSQPLPMTFDGDAPRRTIARFSPDGQRIVSGCWASGSARVWDLRTGRPLTPWIGYGLGIRDVSFGPDSQRIVTAHTAASASAQVWSVHTGQALTPWLTHAGGIRQVEFSPDGRQIVTASFDHTARIWNAGTGEELFRLQHGDEVPTAHFSPDGQRVVTASHDRTARVWNATTGQMLVEVQHGDSVLFAQFSPDGKRLLTASKDKTACLWDAKTGQRLVSPLKHNDELYAAHSPAHFSPDGRRLVTVAGTVAQVWDTQTGRTVSPPLKHPLRINSVRFNPDGEKVVTACQDGDAYIWHATTGHLLDEPLRHPKPVYYAEFGPDGRWVVTAAEDGAARLWEIHKTSFPVPHWLADLAEAAAGQRFVEQGMSDTAPTDELHKLRQRLTTSAQADATAQWAKWFFAESAERRISPSSALPVREFAERGLEPAPISSDLPGFLEQAHERRLMRAQQSIRLLPTNALTQARLALLEITTNTLQHPGQVARIDWQSRRAVKLTPNDPEIWWARAQVCEHLGRAAEAWDAMERAKGLNSTNPAFWNALGLMLEKTNRVDDAFHAYARAAELSGPWKEGQTLPVVALKNRSNLLKRLGRLAEAAAENLKALNLSARQPETPPQMIDLSLHCNRGLDAIGKGLFSLMPSRVRQDGIEFDVRGIIQLSSGKNEFDMDTSESASGIAIRQKCRWLHFLHVGQVLEGGFQDGATNAVYRMRYVDGKEEPMPVVYGHHLRSFLMSFDPKNLLEDGTMVVSVDSTAGNQAVRLFKSTWKNPRPDVAIESLDFITSSSRVIPFLLAITAEP